MKVFLSYDKRDRLPAQRLASRLKSKGLQVWDPARELLPGDNWSVKQGEALEKSDAMIVLLSPDSVDSPWLLHELQFALGSKNFRRRLIPVIVRQTKKIPWILEEFPIVRLNEGTVKASQQILNLLRKRRSATRLSSRATS